MAEIAASISGAAVVTSTIIGLTSLASTSVGAATVSASILGLTSLVATSVGVATISVGVIGQTSLSASAIGAAIMTGAGVPVASIASLISGIGAVLAFLDWLGLAATCAGQGAVVASVQGLTNLSSSIRGSGSVISATDRQPPPGFGYGYPDSQTPN